MAVSKKGFTIEEYNELCKSIAMGAKRVKYTDKEIEFNDLDEMMQAKRIMEKALGLCSSSKTKKGLFGGKRITAIHDKGL